MTEAPDEIEARQAYLLLKHYYSAADIQRRLGLTNRNSLEMILSSPDRRARLINWAASVKNCA